MLSSFQGEIDTSPSELPFPSPQCAQNALVESGMFFIIPWNLTPQEKRIFFLNYFFKFLLKMRPDQYIVNPPNPQVLFPQGQSNTC